MAQGPKSAGGRVRRTAEEAQRRILDAAEKRLREGGPEAIRLQEIAADLGVSHPAILHHFGSRDGLVEALERRALERLQADLLEALTTGTADEGTARQIIEAASATLSDAGVAQLAAWLALRSSGSDDERASLMLDELTDVVHARRLAYHREAGTPAPPREDSQFLVRLTADAMLGDGLFGRYYDPATDRDDPEARRRFRTWLARLLLLWIDRWEPEQGEGA